MATHEVADFLDVNQFLPGRSAYECVAYAAALIKFAGRPGQGPTGTPMQASNLAQYWYGKMEGSNQASNMNGMSVPDMETMLTGMGLHWTAATLDSVQGVKMQLAEGAPCLICGAETGFFDMELGDSVPYNWPPSGNHAIVASGIAPDGINLLVHDTANVDKNGEIRPGPRTYDASKMQLVSVTAVQIGADMSIDLTTPGVSSYFSAHGAGWLCSNGVPIGGAMLTFYQGYGNAALCGLTFLGLPLTGEKQVADYPGYAHLAGKGIVLQFFERGVLCYDPEHLYDAPPGAGSVYLAHLYSGAGVDPEVGILQAQLTALQAAPVVPALTPVELQALEALAAAFGKKIV